MDSIQICEECQKDLDANCARCAEKLARINTILPTYNFLTCWGCDSKDILGLESLVEDNLTVEDIGYDCQKCQDFRRKNGGEIFRCHKCRVLQNNENEHEYYEGYCCHCADAPIETIVGKIERIESGHGSPSFFMNDREWYIDGDEKDLWSYIWRAAGAHKVGISVDVRGSVNHVTVYFENEE